MCIYIYIYIFLVYIATSGLESQVVRSASSCCWTAVPRSRLRTLVGLWVEGLGFNGLGLRVFRVEGI